MAFKKGQSGNPKGRTLGKSFGDNLRAALLAVAKKDKFKSAEEYLINKAKTDSKLLAKLLDKMYSDAPKDVNVTGNITVEITKYGG